jgi:hypothetical protein
MGDFLWATFAGRLLVADFWWGHVFPHENCNSFLIAIRMIEEIEN